LKTFKKSLQLFKNNKKPKKRKWQILKNKKKNKQKTMKKNKPRLTDLGPASHNEKEKQRPWKKG